MTSIALYPNILPDSEHTGECRALEFLTNQEAPASSTVEVLPQISNFLA